MTRSQDIDAVLRSLDAADRPSDRRDPRALRDLERILATDPSAVPLQPPSPRPATQHGRRTTGRRAARTLALAGAVMAAVTAAVIALPPLSGGDPAFATWTPEPDAVPTLERPEAADACRGAHQDGEHAAQLEAAEPVIAERRGVWTTVVLAGPDGFSAMCVTDETRPFYGRGMIGHIGTATGGDTAPGPRELIAHALGDGIVDNNPLSLAAGAAGSDVVGVAYLSPTYGEVTASVAGGHFAFWLPGTELGGASSAGVELQVSYRDGTSATTRLSL